MRFASALTLAAIMLAGVLSPATAQDLEATADEFRNSCASCHGEDGKGAGFLTRLFRGVNPGDLTQLAKKHGGELPTLRIYQVIDGRTEVPAHGHRQMPVWGDRYTVDEAGRTAYGSEAAVRTRIQALVRYIESIQELDE